MWLLLELEKYEVSLGRLFSYPFIYEQETEGGGGKELLYAETGQKVYRLSIMTLYRVFSVAALLTLLTQGKAAFNS